MPTVLILPDMDRLTLYTLALDNPIAAAYKRAPTEAMQGVVYFESFFVPYTRISRAPDQDLERRVIIAVFDR